MKPSCYSALCHDCGRLARIVTRPNGLRSLHKGRKHALVVLRSMLGKCVEWGCTLWWATLDLRKAVEIVDHESLFAALDTAGMPGACVVVWSRSLYTPQTALSEVVGHFIYGDGSRPDSLFKSRQPPLACVDIVVDPTELPWRRRGAVVGQVRVGQATRTGP